MRETTSAVTDDSFQSDVLQAGEPTLVDFWAEWCGPCKMIGPVVEQVATEHANRMRVVKMDVDANPKTPQSLGIRGIPTLILFKNGAEAKRIIGYRTKEALVDELLPHIE
jgi:thioredoxin 1